MRRARSKKELVGQRQRTYVYVTSAEFVRGPDSSVGKSVGEVRERVEPCTGVWIVFRFRSVFQCLHSVPKFYKFLIFQTSKFDLVSLIISLPVGSIRLLNQRAPVQVWLGANFLFYFLLLLLMVFIHYDTFRISSLASCKSENSIESKFQKKIDFTSDQRLFTLAPPINRLI